MAQASSQEESEPSPYPKSHRFPETGVWSHTVTPTIKHLTSLYPFLGLQLHGGNSKCCSLSSYPALPESPLASMEPRLAFATPCLSWSADPDLGSQVAVWDLV